jgi:hypothetical protein
LPTRIARTLFDAKARAVRTVIVRVGLDEVESDQFADEPFTFSRRPAIRIGDVWFGPLGIVLLGLIAVETWRALHTRAILRSGLILMAWSLLLVLSLSTAWSFHKGRYTILLVTLVAPVLARLYFSRGWLRMLTWGLCGLAGFVLVWTIIHNDYRPLSGETPIWEQDRIDLQVTSPRIASMVRLVHRCVPPDATVGLWFKRDDPDYPLFGRNFSRRLEQIYPYPDALDSAWLAQQDFDFVIANKNLLPSAPSPELIVIGETESYILFRGATVP